MTTTRVNRVVVQSTGPATPRTITAASVTVTNTDFMAITGAGAGSWDFSAQVDVGDRLANSGITFPASVTQTRAAAPSAVWSDASKWSTRVPLPQDDVVFNASSANCTATDVLCLGRNLDLSAYTNTLTLTSSTTEYVLFGDVVLGAAMSWGAAPNTFYVDHRGRGPQTVRTNGKQYFPATSNQRTNFYPFGGSYTLLDNVNWATTNNLGGVVNHYAGILDLGSGLTHVGSSLASATTSFARTITCGPGTVINCLATGATSPLNFSTTNLTTNLVDLTLNIAAASATTRTITTGPTAHIGTINYTVADSPGILALGAATGTKITTLNIGSGRSVTVNGPLFAKSMPGAGGADFHGQKTTGIDASNTISQPDAAALRLTGDITCDYKLTLPDWSPAGRIALGGKINGALTTGWCVRIGTTGQPEIICGGVTGGQQSAANALSFANGATGLLRVQRNAATGAFTMYESPDGSAGSWTQLGATPSSTAGPLVANTTDPLYFGSRGAGGDAMLVGTIHRAVVYNALMGTTAIGSSNVVSDANFETKPVGADSFTESSVNAATVSINGTGALRNGDGRFGLSSATGGTPAYISICDRPSWDYVKTKDVFSITQGKLYVGANGTIDTGCTNVHAGTFAVDDPYVRQHTDVSGTPFAFPVLAGSLLVGAVSSTTAAPAWATPAGYTAIPGGRSPAAGPCQIETYTRIADGSETAFTTTTTGGAVSAKCWEVVGADTLDVLDHNSGSAVTNIDAAVAPVTTYGGGKTLGIGLWGGNTFGASGAITDGYGESRTATLSSHFRAASRALPAGASTDPNFSWTGNQNPRSQLLVFKASAPGAGTARVLPAAVGAGF